MATRHAIATMDAEARNRMRLASGRLVTRLGLPDPSPAVWDRNPELRAIYELQAHADFLESLDAALKDRGYSAAPGSAPAATEMVKTKGKQKMTDDPKQPQPDDDATFPNPEDADVGAEVTE